MENISNSLIDNLENEFKELKKKILKFKRKQSKIWREFLLLISSMCILNIICGILAIFSFNAGIIIISFCIFIVLLIVGIFSRFTPKGKEFLYLLKFFS